MIKHCSPILFIKESLNDTNKTKEKSDKNMTPRISRRLTHRVDPGIDSSKIQI